MTHLDICSGIGAFAIAAQWAGFETVGFSEIEPYCCAILEQHWPDICNYGDLRDADFSHLRGYVTVLSAGVPCQPASLAGKRRGARDDRWLWEATLDVVEVVRPDWTILENPPGILTLDEFAGIYLRLESLGYQVAPPLVVSANAVGAKHRRERVFIVAHAERERRHGWPDEWRSETGSRSPTQPGRASQDAEALADTDRTGLEEHQPRQPGQLATLIGSSGTNGSGESFAGILRVVNGLPNWLDGTPMPHPLTTERIPHRSHRLKALGNACVPGQCLPFFLAIAEVERCHVR